MGNAKAAGRVGDSAGQLDTRSSQSAGRARPITCRGAISWTISKSVRFLLLHGTGGVPGIWYLCPFGWSVAPRTYRDPDQR